MAKDLFATPATIQSIRTLVDGGNKLDIVTQELAPDEMTKLFSLKGKLGWLVFSDQSIMETDIPDTPVEKFVKDKTPSQRLYNTLYVLWKETTNMKEPFENYYKTQMEVIIGKIKDKLPNERRHIQ